MYRLSLFPTVPGKVCRSLRGGAQLRRFFRLLVTNRRLMFPVRRPMTAARLVPGAVTVATISFALWVALSSQRRSTAIFMCENSEQFTCPVCGYAGMDEAPYDEVGCSSFGIGPCCGTEFGYDDYSVTHADLRKKWVSGGMLWWSNLVAPPDWDPVEQIKRAVTSHD